jgi:hypothetical protein
MKTMTLEALAGEVGLSSRQVSRYLRALGIRPLRIVDGRNHYTRDTVGVVTAAALSAREDRAHAIRLAVAKARELPGVKSNEGLCQGGTPCK